MSGSDVRTGELFSYVDLEDRVRRDHPLRAIRLIVNETLELMGLSNRRWGVKRKVVEAVLPGC